MSETNPNAKQLEDVGHRLARHLSDALTALRAWRTPTGGMGSNITIESRGRCSMISAEAAIREWAALTYPEAPGHTDLMVTPESLDLADYIYKHGGDAPQGMLEHRWQDGVCAVCGRHREDEGIRGCNP